MNEPQLNDVSNQSQIFFVNMPQQEQKTQQQVLPVTVVQQGKAYIQFSLNYTIFLHSEITC